jgi:hypothetical protein
MSTVVLINQRIPILVRHDDHTVAQQARKRRSPMEEKEGKGRGTHRRSQPNGMGPVEAEQRQAPQRREQ